MSILTEVYYSEDRLSITLFLHHVTTDNVLHVYRGLQRLLDAMSALFPKRLLQHTITISLHEWQTYDAIIYLSACIADP